MDPSTTTISDSPAFASKRSRKLVSNALGGEIMSDINSDRTPLPHEADETARPQAPRLLMQRVDDPDPARARAQLVDDLENGADGLALVFAGAPNAFGYGLPSDIDGLRAALKDVPLQDVHLRIDVHPQSRASIDWLAELLQEKQVNPAGVHLSFGFDPAALFAGTGQLRMSLEALEASLPQSLGGFFALSLPGVLLESDGRVYHNAGATVAQELGIMLASAASHLKMFEEARQPLVYATPHLGFAVSVDQDLLASTAKLRALRLLWAKMLSDYGIEPAPVAVHAETSYRMLSARDPQTNILRTSVASLAAMLGGANSISILPHTVPHGLPDAEARRIARNTSLVQELESGAHDLISASTDVVDQMIDRFCEGAWEEFRRIQSEGGILHSIAAGTVQARIAESRHIAVRQLAEGDRELVGASIFPLEGGSKLNTLPATAPQVTLEPAVTCEKLLPHRMEELLDDSASASTPPVATAP